MSILTIEILVALIMVAVAFTLVVLFLMYKEFSSERRMKRMIERCGLDPEIIARGDKKEIMKEVRRRCSKCQTEDVCERWLAGEEQGGNIFCPNAETFRILEKTS